MRVFQVPVPGSNLQNSLFFHFLSFYYQNDIVLNLYKTKHIKPASLSHSTALSSLSLSLSLSLLQITSALDFSTITGWFSQLLYWSLIFILFFLISYFGADPFDIYAKDLWVLLFLTLSFKDHVHL